MIGAIITNEQYMDMASEASKRFTRHTGLNCIIIHSCANREQLFREKLLALLFCQQTMVLFDSDLWFIRDCNLKEFDEKNDIYAVRDPGRYCTDSAPWKDCKAHDLNVDLYFNSGMVIANMRHRHIFQHAYNLFEDSKCKVVDFGEQSYLNIACQKLGQRVSFLDDAYNYAPFAEFHNLSTAKLKQPYCIHAMGYAGDQKQEALRYYSTKFLSGMDLT